MALRSTSVVESLRVEPLAQASLFEHFPQLYALFRERVFRDDTDRIINSLWATGRPKAGSSLVELGCGPGFYARRLSALFPELDVVGIDRSIPQLELANQRAIECVLPNCHFEWGDAQAISYADGSIDAVVASRLITVLSDPAGALAEIHRVLRPGGCCFIAEPRPHPMAHIPLAVMWAAAGLARLANRSTVSYREPAAPTLLQPGEFATLIGSSPWHDARIWGDDRYQYAVCTKS